MLVSLEQLVSVASLTDAHEKSGSNLLIRWARNDFS